VVSSPSCQPLGSSPDPWWCGAGMGQRAGFRNFGTYSVQPPVDDRSEPDTTGPNEDRPLTVSLLLRGRCGWCGGSRIRTLDGMRRRISRLCASSAHLYPSWRSSASLLRCALAAGGGTPDAVHAWGGSACDDTPIITNPHADQGTEKSHTRRGVAHEPVHLPR
jgi:hypothetical protein